MKKIILTSLVLAASLATSAHAAGDAAAGKAKAAACGGCHGLDGNSPAPTFPKLAGQGEKYSLESVITGGFSVCEALYRSGKKNTPAEPVHLR